MYIKLGTESRDKLGQCSFFFCSTLKMAGLENIGWKRGKGRIISPTGVNYCTGHGL